MEMDVPSSPLKLIGETGEQHHVYQYSSYDERFITAHN